MVSFDIKYGCLCLLVYLEYYTYLGRIIKNYKCLKVQYLSLTFIQRTGTIWEDSFF